MSAGQALPFIGKETETVLLFPDPIILDSISAHNKPNGILLKSTATAGGQETLIYSEEQGSDDNIYGSHVEGGPLRKAVRIFTPESQEGTEE